MRQADIKIIEDDYTGLLIQFSLFMSREGKNLKDCGFYRSNEQMLTQLDTR
jgi:hypothetical protein